MSVRNSLVGLALLALLVPGTALARDLTAAETEALEQTVQAFDAAMRAQEMETVAKTVPPRILEHIAGRAGITVEKLHELLMQQMVEAMAAVKIETFGMDLAGAEHRELDDGTPFVLIPTETVMDAGDTGRLVARGHTLGLIDDGVWYLVRVSDAQQVLILREVYPGFAGVEFPSGTMEALK